MKLTLNTIFFLGFLCIIACKPTPKSETPTTTENENPNIIIFFTDDQGYADLSSYGAVGIKTPHIDALAASGIKLTNFYVPATVCTPSRAGLLTGRYPKRSNLHEAVLFPFSETGIPSSEYTMPEMLKSVGYSTSIIGKWHLGHLPEFMPLNHGFDQFYGVPYSNDMDNHLYKNIDFQSPPLPLYRNEEIIESGPDQRYLTKRYTEEAIAQIQKSDGPFFMYIAQNMPHVPLFASENFKGKSELGLYGDVIGELDWSVGELIKSLKAEGKYENTIFIFTSDNGPDKGSALPLRGRKAQTWEGGQRVPGIITWPAKILSDSHSEQMISTLDLWPTLAGLTNAEIPSDLHLDGLDLSEWLKTPMHSIPERPFYYYARNGELEAIRLGKWKLHNKKSIGWNSKKDGEFPISLYNLSKDVGEVNNLAGEFPEVVEKLKTLMVEFEGSF